MFVKRVEMHGFKSFPDKTIFDLTPGITVIVGPNGCGKSNITDAIRWVLGEQSARHLRGLRMDDIIFSGTSNRKPLSFAEVSLTFDHSDGVLGLEYQEITVTRRIYRNGESEYMLNKRPCRLKDILELFMDTGVGKEAFSFIGQGRVDEIISARPEERRQIFEEAAGIIKYKSRKREAQRRLLETAENLLRVGDIIHELSAQLEPLAQQAGEAQNYLALRDQLKTQEVDVLVHEAQHLRQRWYEVESTAKAAADELLEKQTTVNRQEMHISASQLSLDEEQTTVAATQREAQQLSSDLEKVQGQIAVTEEKIRSVDRQLTENNAFIQELAKQNAIIEDEKDLIGIQITKNNEAIRRAESELTQAKQALTALETSPEAQRNLAVQEELNKHLATVRRFQLEYDRFIMELEQLTEKAEGVAAQRGEKEEELRQLNKQGKTLLTKKDDLTRQKETHVEKIALLHSELDEINEQQAQIGQQQQNAQKELSVNQNKIQVFHELEDAMVGYYQGVKSILAARKKNATLTGIVGTVADIMEVPPPYVVAVEAALGAALQNLVAEDDSVAKDAIVYLKKTKGGRATFLPLNILTVQKRRPLAADVSKLPGYIGVAADLVQAQERFRPVVESMLGRIHFVRTLEAALPIARLLRFRERIVTLEGDVIAPGGAMSGGFDKKQGGVLSRRKEAAALQLTVGQQQQELQALTGKATTLGKRRAILIEQVYEHDKGQWPDHLLEMKSF
ncbi:MAG: chromosome segregation protein SMC, partial [Firmicutes bacterium]|nr:chromosome segregation protein SMC [Bacillota bacterium]